MDDKQTITDEAYSVLMSYLQDHEEDIALSINDFGELKPLFEETQFRSPEIHDIYIKRVSNENR